MSSIRSLLAGLVGLTALVGCGGGSGGSGENEGSSQAEAEAPVVVQSIPAIPVEQQRVIATEEVRAYRPEGPYASVLKDCALAEFEEACTLSVLPYIGQSASVPTIDDVMQRVLVTHDWMGIRFEQMLLRMPTDMLQLFAPVTAIVIGSEVRPSVYRGGTASIRLNPSFLWMTVPEKRTIDIAPDFRTDFGAGLKFRSFSRLAIGNSYATSFSSLLDDNEREIQDLDISLADLLYHELAHANDFLQYDKLAGLSGDLTPWEVALSHEDDFVHQKLYADEQLTAQTSHLYGLGRVRFLDEEPSEFETSVTADFAGAVMGNEGKTIFYAYSSIVEDTATLFGAAMMKYHYDVDYHVGFVDKLENEEEARCDDYKVVWGARNRLAAPLVTPRAQFVVDKMMRPSAARSQFLATGVGTESSLRIGAGWCESVSDEPLIAKQGSGNDRVPSELGAR